MSHNVHPYRHALTRLCLFFYECGNPRDLHSFPTRRSSDLQSSPARSSCSPCRLRLVGRTTGLDCRSGGHTSELQSLTKLVFRLPLYNINFAPKEMRRCSENDGLMPLTQTSRNSQWNRR